jgi:hypothetical protein
MKIKLLFLILVLAATYSYGQIKFEKGYLIDNENHRVDCLIKNYDWKNTPVEFDYKLGENERFQKGNVLNVKEFGISGISKYIMAETKIDRSSEEITTLSKERKPNWSKEQLFLKVLIDGKACLYQYRLHNFERYFYSVSGSPVQQLIYKQYYAQEKSVAYNNDFRQQLWNDVRNTKTTLSSVEKIIYEQSELERYFKQYNDTEQKTIRSSGKNTDFLFLKVKAGIDYSSVAVMQKFYGPEFKNSDQDFNYRVGLEAGYILPFNKNKWEFIIDPSYQYFNKKMSEMSVDYKSIEFPIGLRYNFFLNDYLKLFVNGFFIPVSNFDFHSTVDIRFANTKYHLNVLHGSSYAMGGGVDYKKFSMEFRFYPNSDLLNRYVDASTDYHRCSLIVGYSLFKVSPK